MKIERVTYRVDEKLIQGVLVERFLRKPVFFPMDMSCGWEKQVITKSNERNLFPFVPAKYVKVEDYNLWNDVNVTLAQGLKNTTAELEKHKRFKAYFEKYCVRDLKVIGYPKNGDVSSFDNFYNGAVNEMEMNDQ